MKHIMELRVHRHLYSLYTTSPILSKTLNSPKNLGPNSSLPLTSSEAMGRWSNHRQTHLELHIPVILVIRPFVPLLRLFQALAYLLEELIPVQELVVYHGQPLPWCV
jgi:hypothetical protein